LKQELDVINSYFDPIKPYLGCYTIERGDTTMLIRRSPLPSVGFMN